MYLSKIEGSPSLEVVNLVLEKLSKGEKVISLAIGDPASNTPSEIVEQAYASMNSGQVHYVPSYGTREVREAICRKVKRKNGINADLSETIFLTTKLAVYVSLFAITEPGYEALVPDPGYFYAEPVTLSGGSPVSYRLRDDFSLDIEEIKRKTTKNTRAIIVNSPSNPTGRILSKGELTELYEFCYENGIYIVSDDAYEDLVYDSASHFAVGSLESKPEKVISIFSLSKSYSMTGWRAGYAVASERVVYLINKFLENTITCFPPFIQQASAYALDNGDKIIAIVREEYSSKREVLLEKLDKIPMVECNQIQGAFYAFPKLKNLSFSATEFCKQLLQNQNVALLPGTAFGPSGQARVRISFSGSLEELETGLDRFGEFLRNLV